MNPRVLLAQGVPVQANILLPNSTTGTAILGLITQANTRGIAIANNRAYLQPR